MKRIGLIVVVLILAQTVTAQDRDDKEVKTLLSKYNEIKGFGALDIKVTDVISERAMVVGAYGGVIVNKQIMLGIGGYGFATNIDYRRTSEEDIDLKGGYGGIMLGFVIAPREVVHVTLPLFIGAGSFHQSGRVFDFGPLPGDILFESSSFAVVEPGIQIELNISKSIRVGLGASYRYIQGSNFDSISDGDLSEFAGNVTLKVGKF